MSTSPHMRRATTVGLALCLSPTIYAGGCAEQEEGTPPPSVESRAGGANEGGSGGTSGGGTSGGGTSGGGTSAGKGGSTSGGNTAAGTGGTGEGGASGAAGGDSEGGAGGGHVYDGTCQGVNHAQCDDGNECTDDACNLGVCQHTSNTAPCTDDDDSCTSDVCAGGLCTHPDNGTCECETDSDCDDSNPCTDDVCTPEKTCEYANNNNPCISDDNVCTDDVCSGGACQHVPNDDPCPDDGTACTDDVCSAGSCTHPTNMSCECVVASDCDLLEVDPDNCTFNRCTPAGDCEFVDNDSCGPGTVFVVNTFDSAADWTAGGAGSGVTTPDGRPLSYTGFDNTNIESGQRLHIADSNGATLTMDVASMAGLDRMAITISSTSSNTASMITIGVFDGTTWYDKPLSDYAPIPVEPTTAVIEIPLLDYDIPLGTITKVRLVTNPTGGQKIWYLYHWEVRD